jgi:hypothetical protein
VASALEIAIGSSDRLPLVITSGRPTAPSSRWWSGVYASITPTVSRPGLTAGVTAPSGRRRSSTMGRSRDASRAAAAGGTSARAAASANVRTITASGLASRCLRSRRRRTAASSVASVARWKPPRPFTATIRPARSRAAASASAAAPVGAPGTPSSQRRGPQAGQLLVSEWWRRSPGVAYSARHAGHCANAAMLVRSRS